MLLDLCVYLAVFAFSAVMIALCQKTYKTVRIKKHKNELYSGKRINDFFYYIIGCIFLFPIIAMYGLRYGIGTDYYSYENIYNTLHGASFSDYWVMHKKSAGAYYVEPLYFLLNKMAPSYRILLWIIGVLIFILVFIALKEYAYEISFPLSLIIFLSTQFIYSLNAVRFAVALCFVLHAYIALSNNKIVRFFVFVILATLFHTSMILCVAMFFLKEFKSVRANVIRNVLLILFVIIFPLICKDLFSLISGVPLFARYFSTDVYTVGGTAQVGVTWLLHVVPVILPLIILCWKELKCNDNTKFFFRIAIMEIPFRIIGFYNTWFTRYARCAQIIQVILIPLVLARITDKRKRVALTIYYVAWYIFYFGYYAIVNDQGDSLPYVWVLSNI